LITTALWLDAADNTTVFSDAGTTQAINGAAVQQWNDKSGNGRNATQATAGDRPAYTTAGLNTKNVVTFAAASLHNLGFSGIATSDNNTFVVSVYQRATAGMATIDVGANPGTGGYANWWFTDNVLYSALRNPTSGIATHGAASTATVTFINVLARNNSGTQAWRNGTALGTRQTLGSTTGELNTVGRTFATAGAHNGYIAEIIIGRFDIPDADRQKLEGYLAHKWGLTTNLPSDHPYKTNAPAP
jgi:hypothetical protein